MEGAPPGTEWHDVGHDNEDYWRLMCRVWGECAKSGYDLLILEHDVVCRPDIIEQFESCPDPWCLFGYDDFCHPECAFAWKNAWGCTRFRHELIAKTPYAISSIPSGFRDWHNLCDHVAGDKMHGVDTIDIRPHSIRSYGFDEHWHMPPPVHHHMGRNDSDRLARGLPVYEGDWEVVTYHIDAPVTTDELAAIFANRRQLEPSPSWHGRT